MQYALGRWEALTRYTGESRLAIDNYLAERLLRGAILYTGSRRRSLPVSTPEVYLAYAIDHLARGHLASRLC